MWEEMVASTREIEADRDTEDGRVSQVPLLDVVPKSSLILQRL